jgi:hypothetical protein
MNGTCAGGTGAFIDQMATLLNVTADEMDELSLNHSRIYPIASRCGVFAKTDIQPLLNQGARKEDVAAAMDLVEEAQRIHIKGPIRFQADFFNRQKEIAERLNYQKRYHKQEARRVHAMGAMDDYCEVWEFPCCGCSVVVGDGPVSRFRSDGCCREEDNAKA